MTEEQYVRVNQIYEWYVEEIKAILDDLLSVEDQEIQEALILKLQEQFRFK